MDTPSYIDHGEATASAQDEHRVALANARAQLVELRFLACRFSDQKVGNLVQFVIGTLLVLIGLLSLFAGPRFTFSSDFDRLAWFGLIIGGFVAYMSWTGYRMTEQGSKLIHALEIGLEPTLGDRVVRIMTRG